MMHAQCNFFSHAYDRASIRLRNRPDFSRRKFLSDRSLARVPLSSTGFPKNRLPSAYRSAGFDCRSETGRALRTSPLLLSWLLRSYPKLPISMMIQRCCIKVERRIKRIIGDSLVRLSRTCLEPGRRVVDRSYGHWWWIPIARGSPSDEQRVAEARRKAVVTPRTDRSRSFPFSLVESTSKTPVCVLGS